MRHSPTDKLLRAAAIVVGGFFASGVLGLIRTAAFSVTFGPSDSLDAFYAAQRIPEALFVVVAGGALGSSFIPVFGRFQSQGDERGRMAARQRGDVVRLRAGDDAGGRDGDLRAYPRADGARAGRKPRRSKR